MVFASMNSHVGYELSRRDDMESFLYLLVYLATGQLPWLNSNNTSNALIDQTQLIKEQKVSLKADELCVGLPLPFMAMFQYVRNLEFEDKPDYEKMKKAIRAIIGKTSGRPAFDWNVTKSIHPLPSPSL